MTTFALIHGGGGGGWCWELLVPELERRGHRAVAPDMPTEDPHAGAREYAQIVVDALDGAGDDVIVVGHSLGGMTVPVVASLRPVRRMVFLGAMVPAPGEVYGDFLATRPDALTAAPSKAVYDENNVRPARTWEEALHAYFHDIPEEDARRAWKLLRPQSGRLFAEPSPMDAWPAVPSTYILMTEDKSVAPDFSRWIARERLGVEAIEMPGSHSPYFSHPAELADILTGLER